MAIGLVIPYHRLFSDRSHVQYFTESRVTAETKSILFCSFCYLAYSVLSQVLRFLVGFWIMLVCFLRAMPPEAVSVLS